MSNNVELLSPVGTAAWLIKNTSLSFKQIAEFCDLHILEVESIADGNFVANIAPKDPIAMKQLTREEITACEKDHSRALKMESDVFEEIEKVRSKSKRKYVTMANRHNKPNAILWLVKTHPALTDAQVIRLIGTTKKTIEKIRNNTNDITSTINPKDPVILGMCTQTDLDSEVEKASK